MLALALAVVPYVFALVLSLCSCSPIDEAKDLGADVAEVSYCEVEACGSVFLCETSLPYGDTLQPELCWMDDDAAELARALTADGYGETTCSPTPRGGALGWPCLWCAKGRGCNAYQGCFGCGGG